LRYSPSRMMKILIFVQIYILNNHINHRNTRSHSEGLATWFGALVLMAWRGHQSIGIYPLCLESLLGWPQTIYHWRFQQESSRWPTSCSCFATRDRNQQAVSAFVRPHYLVLSKSTPMCCWKTTTKQSCNFYRRTEMWSNRSWLVCNPIPIMWKFWNSLLNHGFVWGCWIPGGRDEYWHLKIAHLLWESTHRIVLLRCVNMQGLRSDELSSKGS